VRKGIAAIPVCPVYSWSSIGIRGGDAGSAPSFN
jgi:hypothetical protein